MSTLSNLSNVSRVEIPEEERFSISNGIPSEESQGCCLINCIVKVWTWIKEAILDCIRLIFQSFGSCCSTTTIPLSIDESIRDQIAPAPSNLAAASEEVVSKKLSNLGNTCYLNATLQMIARVNAFNDMLTTPLPRPANDGLTHDQFQSAVTRWENKQALQAHLSSIIHEMRTPDGSDTVSSQRLKVLFHLLQVCGWRKHIWQQQDPHELLLCIKGIFNSESLPNTQLRTVSKYSYQIDGEERSHLSRQEEQLTELSLALPVDRELKVTTDCKDMESLISHYLKEEDLEDFRPLGDGTPAVDTKKSLHFLSPAPELIFIQEKRFGSNQGQPYRISTPVPQEPIFNTEMSIPFYRRGLDDETTLLEHETRTYRLVGAICHRGGKSAEGGHYTFVGAHRYQEKPLWVIYNDSRNPDSCRDPLGNRTPPTISNKLKTEAYYLAYELIEGAEEDQFSE